MEAALNNESTTTEITTLEQTAAKPSPGSLDILQTQYLPLILQLLKQTQTTHINTRKLR